MRVFRQKNRGNRRPFDDDFTSGRGKLTSVTELNGGGWVYGRLLFQWREKTPALQAPRSKQITWRGCISQLQYPPSPPPRSRPACWPTLYLDCGQTPMLVYFVEAKRDEFPTLLFLHLSLPTLRIIPYSPRPNIQYFPFFIPSRVCVQSSVQLIVLPFFIDY